MEKKRNPWWRDARFIIPTILVPVALALVGLFPYFLSDRVSDKLSVALSVVDPRRPGASLFDKHFTEEFEIVDSSESEAAEKIVRSITNNIFPAQSPSNEDRQKISLTIHRAEDGTLFVNESQSSKVGLHLTRFSGIQALESLIAVEEPNIMVQMTVEELRLPPEATEIPIPEREFRAGVYRIVLTAPGYNDHSTYVQLTDTGQLLTLSNMAVVEQNFPISADLTPRRTSSLKVAIHPCRVTLPPSSRPKYANIHAAIQNELTNAIRQRGFIAVAVEEDQDVGFDVNISKGLPPSEGFVSADLLVKDCTCEWKE